MGIWRVVVHAPKCPTLLLLLSTAAYPANTPPKAPQCLSHQLRWCAWSSSTSCCSCLGSSKELPQAAGFEPGCSASMLGTCASTLETGLVSGHNWNKANVPVLRRDLNPFS
eukprot:1153379-Pelagomonas_calceolata.AAC.3